MIILKQSNCKYFDDCMIILFKIKLYKHYYIINFSVFIKHFAIHFSSTFRISLSIIFLKVLKIIFVPFLSYILTQLFIIRINISQYLYRVDWQGFNSCIVYVHSEISSSTYFVYFAAIAYHYKSFLYIDCNFTKKEVKNLWILSLVATTSYILLREISNTNVAWNFTGIIFKYPQYPFRFHL